MAGKRRRRRGTWFPTIGTQRQVPEDDPFGLTFRRMVLTIPTGDTGFDTPVVGVIPITLDEPQRPDEQSSDTHGIADFIGNEYIVSRIVGQCFASRTQIFAASGSSNAWPAIYLTCAFFVARAADGSSIVASDAVPVGFTAGEGVRLYSCQATDNIREPWMWRRSWLLGQGGARVQETRDQVDFILGAWDTYPANNTLYPNMSDHRVDIKSKRRVAQDERLWFAASATPTVNTEGNQNVTVEIALDLRIFGNIVKARNHGSF